VQKFLVVVVVNPEQGKVAVVNKCPNVGDENKCVHIEGVQCLIDYGDVFDIASSSCSYSKIVAII
jgi:hypothetical protein